MLFRFWLITSLIVAFVAYAGAFGIQRLSDAAFADRGYAAALLDEDGGRER